MWSARDDKFHYSTEPIQFRETWTKRNILSEIAKIFDPIGLSGPTILHAKIIMQNVWRCSLQWDESVPQTIHSEWATFVKELRMLNQFAVERKTIDNNRRMSRHTNK